MQRGSGRRAADAAPAGIDRRFGRIAVLLAGLALSACVNAGQIANLTETGRPAVAIAIESVDGAPAAVVHRFVDVLKDEAAARQIAVVAPSEANYRLRGYLAAPGADGAAPAASVAWVLDVYGADRQRAIRLSGEEKTAGRMWEQADDEVLRRIARAGMEQLAAFLGAARPPSAPAALAASPRQPASSLLGSLDDWAPEASGIFRILRGDPAKAEAAADAAAALPPGEVPLPRRRPAGANPAALAFAPEK